MESVARDFSRLPSHVWSQHRYCVYGVGIASDSPLTLPRYSHDALCEVECLRGNARTFLAALDGARFDPRSDAWHRYAALDDGSAYARWETIGEFLVAADGRQILSRQIGDASAESFQVYLLGQALSFALVKQRFEPLHATVVAVGGRAVAFLGGNAFGKSTLAACFLEAGFRLMTDDLLMVRESGGAILAYPGPPRIKLFPSVARQVLCIGADAVRMNSDTGKLIVPIDERRTCAAPVPLRAIYSLAVPAAGRRDDVRIEALAPRQALLELVKSAFNRRLLTRDRVERQLGVMTHLASVVPVKQLVYPRAIDRLPDVRAIVLRDLAGRML
ncbi:MAG TPA: hypothetical protein VGY48_19895 [Vicinamibacterales bacterium]|nr:hypothetical protein [Vicinamibacterales bacterium]